jgi:chemotaxis receptor (MCP) glutamine deamidase CheD
MMMRTVDTSISHARRCGIGSNLRVKSRSAEDAAAARRSRLLYKNRISLYIGDVAASRSPAVLGTLLGSCVAVCLYDPVLRAGGMNHILLPNCKTGDRSPRSGTHAMELLINELMKLGGDRRRFIAKAFGGANVLQGIRMLPIGEGNAKFVREFLSTEKIPLVAERLGGNHAVHLYFHTDSGKATVHTVDGSILPKIISDEGSFCRLPAKNQFSYGDITLF